MAEAGAGAARAVDSRPLLEVCDLDLRYLAADGTEVHALDGVSLELHRGRTVALVGESGSGKSTLALAIPGLLAPRARIVGGEIWYRGSDLTKLSSEELRRIRGRDIGFVFQEPATAFNPVLTIGAQIEESLTLHASLDAAEARERAVELLARVGFARPASWLDAWPHQLSGGMLQRAMIAMAIGPRPRLLIADEPTASLDTTIQAQVLELLGELCEQDGTGLLLVSHSLGLVAAHAHRVAVMYAGRVVERGPVGDVFRHPRHPYTRALFECEPGRHPRGSRLPTLPPAAPESSPLGCRFRGRCTRAADACVVEDPRLPAAGDGEQAAACLFPVEEPL